MSPTQTQARNRRAERARAEKRKRQIRLWAIVAVAVVVVVILILVLVGLTGGSSDAGPSQPAPSGVTAKVTSVPISAIVAAEDPAQLSNPAKPVSTKPLTKDGKPYIVYFGGEFCPYCAADRWVTVVALSQFGDFHNLWVTHSAGDDVYPNTPTLSFRKSSYTSKYLAFSGYELTDQQRKTLETPPKSVQNLPSETGAGSSIPFLDVGGKWVQSGAPYSPQILAHKSWQEVADALHTPSSPIYQTVLANAAELVQHLCTLTGNQPGKVCNAFASGDNGSSSATTVPATGTTAPDKTKLKTPIK